MPTPLKSGLKPADRAIAQQPTVRLYRGDCLDVLRRLTAGSVHCVVTSPPYWGLRDYGVAGQLGLESTPEEYVAKLVGIFREVRRVLRPDGTVWLNLGDSYYSDIGGGSVTCTVNAGPIRTLGRRNKPPHGTLKPKDLVGIPWRVALALQADGWYLRSDIIWHKPNAMPESVRDRPTKSHEYLFLFAKSERYYFDSKAVCEPVQADTVPRYSRGRSAAHKYADGGPGNQTLARSLDHMRELPAIGGATHAARLTTSDGGPNRPMTPHATRNIRSVWTIPTQPYKGAHFATFPRRLVSPCIKAGCPVGGVVLDPFCGSGTTGAEALSLGRDFIGIDLSPAYLKLAQQRIIATCPDPTPTTAAASTATTTSAPTTGRTVIA